MRIIFLFLFLLLWSSLLHSQKIIFLDNEGREIPVDTSRWMPKYHVEILKSMRMSYSKPDSFTEIPGTECFNDDPKLQGILSCAGNQLHSNDGEFIAFLPVYKAFTNSQHSAQIRANILQSLGKDASLTGENANFNWRQYVTYYSDKEAKQKFNADTVIKVPLPLKKDEAYLGKYNNLTCLALQKKDRGYVMIYGFYTDNAKRSLDYYWKQVEGIFKYDE